MPIVNRIASYHNEMTEWRRDIHAHPEMAFEEKRTADVVARQLESFGIEVHRGLAKTGVVGQLKNGDGPSIGLRADMDALPIQGLNDFANKSKKEGTMHACGHDGHTTMLLGAAKYLSETKNFNGTINFIFQPAEEGEGGARVMIEEGLFEKFPCDSIYGMHNMPGMESGTFGVRSGPLMAAFDTFDIHVNGRGSHAAMPQQSIDPLAIGAQILTALQNIVSRNVHPIDSAVVSVTQFHGGTTMNVIPDNAYLGGTVRCFKPEIQDFIEESIRRIADGIAAAHGASVKVEYERRYPPTINHDNETAHALKIACDVVGVDQVDTELTPVMGSEDYAFMLQERPGCYLWIGNGPGEGGCMLHNSHYDFNDEILPVGASFFARMVEHALPVN